MHGIEADLADPLLRVRRERDEAGDRASHNGNKNPRSGAFAAEIVEQLRLFGIGPCEGQRCDLLTDDVAEGLEACRMRWSAGKSSGVNGRMVMSGAAMADRDHFRFDVFARGSGRRPAGSKPM